jgi:vacuolar-type H+-ATPase subunit E/Vma4
LKMGKVKDKILKDAEKGKKSIEKETADRIEKIREEARKEASIIEDKGKEQAKKEEKLETQRILSRVRMNLSNKKLEKKNSIMYELKEKVAGEMKNLKWEEYKPVVRQLILSASEDGDEEITTGTLHSEKVKELIEELNRDNKNNFKISPEKPDFEIGVVLSKGKRRVIATLPVLLEEIFDQMQEEIVGILFKSE